ncbi:MAG: hypothetical protein A2044_03695 [Candidatus Firestonebacteria bacterium GWA2_43_8]|nr:MAG: hypothetical protein A2044_03695 [Candidatus Firestonebacteria bacterium GWA2_43_8]
MENTEIGEIFYEIGELLEVLGENKFKVRAYYKGAEVISSYPYDLRDIYNKDGVNGLLEIKGIGKGLAEKIEEHVKTGNIQYINELKKKLPPGILELLRVQSVGPKKAKLFYEKLGIKDLSSLEKAANENKLRELPGMGEKSEKSIIRSLVFLKKDKGRILLGAALPLGELLVASLSRMKEVSKVEYAGSLRRGKETIGDIDILAASKKPEEVIKYFCGLSEFASILSKGPTKAAAVTKNGVQVDLRVIELSTFGAALNYFTGSKDHNIKLREIAIKKGLKLSEYGLTREKDKKNIASETEESIYKTLGLSYIPPELREDRGEIELAAKQKMPELLRLSDIKGDLHMHTDASDGVETLEDMIKAARSKGYEYIAVTDHSESLKVANGLSGKRLLARVKEISKINSKLKGFRILAGSEVDIKPDGTLDYDPEVHESLDYAIGSVHTNFGMSREEMTKRVINAIKSGKITTLGHPSGRVIGQREAYAIDLIEVIKAAKDYNVAIELSAHPMRLDLTDIYCKVAKEKGVKIAISTDAHTLGELDMMKYGVITARRGWLEKKNVLNCLAVKDLIEFLKKRK